LCQSEFQTVLLGNGSVSGLVQENNMNKSIAPMHCESNND